jgi:hypothetical protein
LCFKLESLLAGAEEDPPEGLPEEGVEHGVDDGVEGGVEVPQPRDEVNHLSKEDSTVYSTVKRDRV